MHSLYFAGPPKAVEAPALTPTEVLVDGTKVKLDDLLTVWRFTRGLLDDDPDPVKMEEIFNLFLRYSDG